MIRKLKNNKDFIKYFKNTSWFFAEKILRIIVGLFVGIWIARYLGPEQFGILSYVGAFVGLFAPLGKLGFDGIISRDVARDESDINELLSSSAFFKLLGSFMILLFTSTYMYIFKEDKIYFYLAILSSFIFLFKSFEVIEFYFRAKVKAKFISIANSVAMLFAALLKIAFIVFNFSLIYFAIANVIEVIVAIVILTIFFNNEPNFLMISKIKLNKGFQLIKESWPLIFSGFFALVYLNIDQIMIEEMLNSYEVGQYSAAVRISSAFYFIPLTIGWSIQTAIVKAKQENEKLYYKRLEQIFIMMAILGYILILPLSFFSNEIISLSFGENYQGAGDVLSVHAWAGLFLFLNVGRSLWIMNESFFKLDLIGNMLAGVLNIGLNYILLPLYGIYGAAIATLISYFFTYVLSSIIFVPSRKILVMQLKSLLLLNLFTVIRVNYYENRRKLNQNN